MSFMRFNPIWWRSRRSPLAREEGTIAEVPLADSPGNRPLDRRVDLKGSQPTAPDAERARTRELIQQAAHKAERELIKPAASEAAFATTNDDLTFLRKSLVGYEILNRIHHGGQGIVYRARQTLNNRIVALKVLLDGPFAARAQRLRFDREIEIVSRLRHPNIVTLYESGLVAGRQYFAMEFVEGLTIDRHVVLNDLPVRQCIELFVVVCQAVSHAHQHGIIHRDLKPSNILVDSDGQPHVLDFGLAKDFANGSDPGGAASLSLTGQVLGTWPYLSPEQAAPGADDDVDVRSDIYSLAVVLFETLTGRLPYLEEATPRAFPGSTTIRDPMPLRKGMGQDLGGRLTVKDVDRDLEAVVAKSLEADKSRRYQSAAALAEDLERWLGGIAVEARSASRLYLLRKTARRYRTQLIVLTAFLTLLVGALAGMTILWRQSERLARIYQTGLETGSMLKLGGVQRDDGRIEQAVTLFEKVIEIGEVAGTSDPVVRRNVYDAHHRLAELMYQEGDTRAADPHCEAAIAISDASVADDPESVEWRRLQGASYVLAGRMADSRNEWKNALANFTQAASIRMGLVALDPDNESFKVELAFARARQGKCHRKLKQFDKSLLHYTAAHALYRELVALGPGVADYEISLICCENSLAAWHISQKTPPQDSAASEWLSSAKSRLNELNESGQLEARQREFSRIMDTIAENERLLVRRAEKHGE